MKRTTIAIPDDLSELVEHEANRHGVSVSEWIRRAIRNAILGGLGGFALLGIIGRLEIDVLEADPASAVTDK